MKKQVLLIFTTLFVSLLGSSQSFTDASSNLPQDLFSGGCVAVTDMNGDGFDDILTLDNSTDIIVLYQNLDGVPGFTLKEFGSVSGANQWGMAIADVNNDGHKDVFSGGNHDGVHYCQITDPNNSELFELTEQLFVQGTNLADINNDGWLDAFGCNDVGHSVIWGNDGAGNLSDQTQWIDMVTTPASDNSGNYGTVWSDIDNDNDLDLVIAKCRQGVTDPNDPRRINAAFMNDGEGNYTDEALERGLVIYEQSWTVDFADIDNDGDFDCLFTNHTSTLILMENDGCGNFTDITENSGLEIPGFFLQAKMVDFDNDGYVDLITSGGTPGFYKNSGDNTFEDLDINTVLPGDDNLHSFGLGDLNMDGYLDIYASYGDTYVNPDYANPDRLWMNDGGTNNWIGFDLDGTDSNKDAVGAKIQIYGDFGTQIREVRSGESYGITNSNLVHFGLGTSTTVDYAVIKWPSGNVEVMENLSSNEYYGKVETSCATADIAVTAESMTVCEGGTTMVSVDATGIVLWSNGEIGTSVTAGSGNHSAVVLNGGCASLSNAVCIGLEVDPEPVINVMGDLNFCEGESVTLEAPMAISYAWSNDSDTQSIEVTESGTYSVMIEGCADDLQSNIVEVTVMDNPDVPVSSDITTAAGSIELTATGSDLVWFTDDTATEIIGTGSPINVDLNTSTTLYVANQNVGGFDEVNGGKLETSPETGAYHDNNNNSIVFSAFEDFVIRDVTVYSNGAADRNIVVYNSMGAIIADGTFAIPDGESVVELDFFIPEGEDYVINVTDDNPQLWRDGAGSVVNFPYDLGALGAITGTTIPGTNEFSYYYFFYDWNVETPAATCYSELVPVQVIISGLEELTGITSFVLFPNPASTEVRYEYSTIGAGNLFITLTDTRGRDVYTSVKSGQTGAHQGVIDLSEYAPGVYNFTLIENGKVASQKLIIE